MVWLLSRVWLSLRPHGLYSPWNSPGQNTGGGSLSLLQGIYQLRDWTQLSHITGGLVAQLQCRRPGSISGSARSPGEGTGYHSSVLYTVHTGVHAFSVASVMSEVFVTLWAVALQAPLSIRFSRQEDWSGLPCPSPGDLPNPGTKPAPPASPALQVDSFPTEPPRKPFYMHSIWAIYCMYT